MVTVTSPLSFLALDRRFLFLKVSFLTFLYFVPSMALPYTGYKRFFFSSATFAVRFWSASKPTHLRPEPRPLVAKPRENDDRFFEGINPIFARVFHLIRLGRKRKPRKKSLWHPG